jgi:metal-dependent amidase/aminoacylase/carboxypeptidase family protein
MEAAYPSIGVLGEFDATWTFSKAQTTKEVLNSGAAGHGCGHNMFGAGRCCLAIIKINSSWKTQRNCPVLWNSG